MPKFHINDQVQITAGKDRGKKGNITKVFPQTHRVLVEGINLYTKHRRALANQPSGKITFPRPLPVANIALLCPQCHQPTRINFKLDKQGKKSRICAKCHQPISVSTKPTASKTTTKTKKAKKAKTKK
jgi:large subunit ribosomal protein L24